MTAKRISNTSKPAFPTKELKAWLTGRKNWNHDEWLALLAELRSKGFGALTDSKDGQQSIGRFLEENRCK